jgi:CubicO group peptidase (beta-lactamase class C family)
VPELRRWPVHEGIAPYPESPLNTRILLAAMLLCLSLPLLSQGSAAAASQALAADTPSATANGNPFIAPLGWTLERRGSAVILTAPEGGSRIVLLDVAAADADAAVAAAWAAYDPAAKWPLKLATDRPARNGWEASRAYVYETSASDARSVSAQALPYQGTWTVAILDMANDVGDKRAAQVTQVFDRLLPKGYERESFAGKTAHALDAARIAALRDFVENSRLALDVPGVAIGIVQSGKVVFADGFGVRALGRPDKVDADTSFMIASNGKALTTLMLAKLVDQGRFGWETPVTQLLPTFKLGDADTTRQVLVKHLVCACTGLPRHDLEFIFEGERFTPETTMASLATMQPTTGFGKLFQYSNSMAAAGGYAGGHVLYPDKELGAAYDAAMQALVFDPLGMRSSTFDFAKAQTGNYASPHGTDIHGRAAAASIDVHSSLIPARPAGTGWSTVNDMLRYVQMELDKGLLPDGTRYIGEDALLERRKQQAVLGNDYSYGMGLMVDRTLGTPVVHHGGDLLGFHADMIWLPDHNVGAVILTNSTAGMFLRGPFKRRLLEVLFDGKPEAMESVTARAALIKQEHEAERERLTAPADTAVVARLAGHYTHPTHGEIAVSRSDSATWFDFGGWKSEMATRRNEDSSVSLVTISPGVNGFEFLVGDTGANRSLTLRDAQHAYIFEETGPT